MVLVRDGHGFRAGKVLLHAEAEGTAISIIKQYVLSNTDRDAGYAEWRPTGAAEVFVTSDILDVVIYTELCDGNVGTLLPCEFR